MSKSNLGMRACAVLLLWTTAAVAVPAQTFTTLHDFDSADGQYPAAGLVQGTNGNLYGTTSSGGAYGEGTVFKIATTGTLTTIYNFCPQSGCLDGAYPTALVQGSDGNFYGTTLYGGSEKGLGTVFKITPDGTLTTLHTFHGTDGAAPYSGVVQGADGNFYGTTALGGSGGINCSVKPNLDCGTVFKVTSSGALTTIYNFCARSRCTDGGEPVAALVQGTDGNFYGTNVRKGVNRAGTIFEITPNGVLTTLHSFDIADGAVSDGALVQAPDGNFYGTTFSGGANGGGTVFRNTQSGTLTTLYSFCAPGDKCQNGYNPSAGLVLGSDGNFYGTTSAARAIGGGTVFKITRSGTLTTVYNFCSQINDGICTDGSSSFAALFQDTNGDFYGTTTAGGTDACNFFDGCGTVFSLSLGLERFVMTLPHLLPARPASHLTESQLRSPSNRNPKSPPPYPSAPPQVQSKW